MGIQDTFERKLADAYKRNDLETLVSKWKQILVRNRLNVGNICRVYSDDDGAMARLTFTLGVETLVELDMFFFRTMEGLEMDGQEHAGFEFSTVERAIVDTFTDVYSGAYVAEFMESAGVRTWLILEEDSKGVVALLVRQPDYSDIGFAGNDDDIGLPSSGYIDIPVIDEGGDEDKKDEEDEEDQGHDLYSKKDFLKTMEGHKHGDYADGYGEERAGAPVLDAEFRGPAHRGQRGNVPPSGGALSRWRR